ncbi:YolD-like family protein [Paenibacillus sp. GCM10027626]|uniref:YolD-like family protein n=1 Tax=Paenibacillus sp. GCM10027626 TaxID=3273411 RepID=UPI00363B69C3
MAKAKVPKRPTRDEFVMEELGNQVTEAFHEKSNVMLTIWGWEEPLRGQIVHLDSRTGKVHVRQPDEQIVKVPFMDIMSLDYPRE